MSEGESPGTAEYARLLDRAQSKWGVSEATVQTKMRELGLTVADLTSDGVYRRVIGAVMDGQSINPQSFAALRPGRRGYRPMRKRRG